MVSLSVLELMMACEKELPFPLLAPERQQVMALVHRYDVSAVGELVLNATVAFVPEQMESLARVAVTLGRGFTVM